MSVAVSTYQRSRLLPRLIEALERQSLPRDAFEVVIVDNGSTDDTYEVLEKIVARSGLNLRIMRLERNQGPARGRNAAWRQTRASIVAFTDDDCAPTPDWLEAGLATMRDGIDIAVGQTLPAPDQKHLLGAFSRTMWTTDERYYATCNVFYRREDLEAVGGFDEGFESPAGEDTDLAYRVRRLGRRSAFSTAALVHHDVRPSSFRATVRETLRWSGIVRMVARNPDEARREHLWKRYFWKDGHPKVIAAAVGLVFAPIAPIAVLLTLPYLQLRLKVSPRTWSRVGRFLVLPGTFAIDVLEVYVMLRGSIRYRTLVI